MATATKTRTNGAKADESPEDARQSQRVRDSLERARATQGITPTAVPSSEAHGSTDVKPAVTEGRTVLVDGATSGTFPTLRAALSAFQATLPRIAKAQTATVTSDKGRYQYAYADLTDVTDVIVPRLALVGLSWSAMPTTNDAGMFVLEYALEHDESGEVKAGHYPLPDPNRSTPQAIGSAITYARRYTLTAVTGVAPGGDDDDAQSAQEAARQRAAERQDQRPQGQRQATAPATPAAPALSDADADSLAASLVGELTSCANQDTFRSLWGRVMNGPVKGRQVGRLIDAETRQVLSIDQSADVTLEEYARAVASYVKGSGQAVAAGVLELMGPADDQDTAQ